MSLIPAIEKEEQKIGITNQEELKNKKKRDY
jgi:hypothetical protein